MSLSYNQKAVITTSLIAIGGFAMMLELGAMAIEQTVWPYLPAALAGLFIWVIGAQLAFNIHRDQTDTVKE